MLGVGVTKNPLITNPKSKTRVDGSLATVKWLPIGCQEAGLFGPVCVRELKLGTTKRKPCCLLETYMMVAEFVGLGSNPVWGVSERMVR